MSAQQQNEQNEIIEILKLLQETFKGQDNKKIEESKNKLQQKIVTDLPHGITLLIKALSLSCIDNKQIPLDVHKSVLIYLKNLFLSQIKNINEEQLSNYLLQLFELALNSNKINQNFNNPIMLNIFQNMVTNLLSSQNIYAKQEYIVQLFNILLNKIKSETKDNFLQTGKIVILLCTSLLSSKSANQGNYVEILNNYYLPIVNIVFANVPNFLDPKKNYYNNEFISILKNLFDGFYTNLSKTRGILEASKRKEIAIKFFREYGVYSYELIQLSPPMDEASAKKYGKPNPIIVFNDNEKLCNEINFMKSKAIQFLSFITQMSTIEEKNDEENKNYINEKELVELINKIIFLIVNTFEDILNSKEKFYFLRKYKPDSNEEEDCYNILLFQICVFLTRSLIREPIKTNFAAHIKQFLLNILFPMIVTIDDEEEFLEMDPEGYHQYINDISTDFKIKNFRTSGCFLINKICERYDDMCNFVLSFNIEMLNYIINEGNIKSDLEYNIYLNNIKDALINKFNDRIKIDFTLLIILILKDRLKKNSFLKNKVRDILINNQDKIHSIPFPIIKIKLCKIYNFFLPNLFNEATDINENVKKNFIEKAINFLLNNIIQTGNKDYLQALAYEASDIITDILNLPTGNEFKENENLISYATQNLEKNFGIFNQLIENVDVYSFFLVIDQIINNIKITQRNLLFECMNNLSKKFQKHFLGQSTENKLFANQYFNILSSFLTGKNKIKSENKEEIQKFNKFFDPILNYIKNPKKFNLYEELVSITEDYIKAFNGINERSALVLKNIKLILEKEKTTSSISFSFVSTFLLNIQKNISEQPLDQEELFNEILDIIKMSFSFGNDTLETSKIYALLLTLQILNLNPNLKEDILGYLIIQSLNSFEYVKTNEDFPNDRNNINQLSIANVSLGFIFKPDLTFTILKQKTKINENQEILYFDKYIQLIALLFKINFPDYNPLLGKCLILGICGILTDKTCLDYLNSHKDKKLYIVKTFLNFVIKHKKEKNLILNKLMRKELKCNFVEDEDEEEEEEEDDEVDAEFNDKVEQVLSGNDSINNCDEFKYYTQVMKFLKKNDQQIYSFLVQETTFSSGNGNYVEELFKVRNIKIKYNNKEFTVPRKTVRIVRTIN